MKEQIKRIEELTGKSIESIFNMSDWDICNDCRAESGVAAFIIIPIENDDADEARIYLNLEFGEDLVDEDIYNIDRIIAIDIY